MLGRYRIVRGRRPPDEPLPAGTRHDTRKHTRHVLRPEPAMVALALAAADAAAWQRFAAAYERLLERRFAAAPESFAALARLARDGDLWLGCNCPTAKNPDVRRCHTVLAMAFLARRFPDLELAPVAVAQRARAPRRPHGRREA